MAQKHGEQQEPPARNYKCSSTDACAQYLKYTGLTKHKRRTVGKDRTTANRTRNTKKKMEMGGPHTEKTKRKHN